MAMDGKMFSAYISESELFWNRLLMRCRKLDKLIKVMKGGTKLYRNRAANCQKAPPNGLKTEYVGRKIGYFKQLSFQYRAWKRKAKLRGNCKYLQCASGDTRLFIDGQYVFQ